MAAAYSPSRRIAKGTRILEYLGERMSHKAADERYEDHDENDNHTFLFIVDKHTVIDAGVGGNDARFINHQCAGNCESVIENRRVFIDAARDIAAGRGAGLRLRDRPRQGRSAERRRDLRLPLRLAAVPRHHVMARRKKPEAETSHAEAAAGGEAASSQEPKRRPQAEAPRRASAAARAINQLIEQLAARGFGVVDDFVDAACWRNCARVASSCSQRRAATRARRPRRERAAGSRSARRFHRLVVASRSSTPSSGCWHASTSCASR